MKLIISLFLILTSSLSHAFYWDSPTDKKYKERNPEHFSKFVQARDIVDNRGTSTKVLIEAEALLNEILSEDKSFAPAYREFGRIYIARGYVKENTFRKGSLSPNLGIENGSLSPAEGSILKAIKIEPNYADAYVLLGHLYGHQKRYSDAMQALEYAEKIGTESPWLESNKGDLYYSQGDYKRAFDEYMKVVNSQTKNKRALGHATEEIAAIYRHNGDYDNSNKWYLKHIDINKNSAWAYGNYGWFLLYIYQDVDGAIEVLEKALSISNYGIARKDYASALYTKWAQTVDTPMSKVPAQTYFDKAYEIYPNVDRIIKDTSRSSYTLITAKKLWALQQKGEL